MNFLDMFADSIHLAELRESTVAGDGDEIELGQALLETQCCVNAFVGSIGQCLASNIVADTYMMVGEPFSTDTVKIFSIAVVLFNRDTKKQHSYVIPFKLVLKNTDDLDQHGNVTILYPGLYLDLP